MAIRYPVRKATLSLSDTSPAWPAHIEAQQGTLDATVRVSDDVAPVHPPRPMLVQDGDHVYRIPWTEDRGQRGQRVGPSPAITAEAAAG